MELLIMAAGMGSRFGGLKQIESMGPNGEFIIDYSVYDAIKNGFNKIVFIIKEENYNIFKDTIGKRVEPHIKVEYVFQKMENIPPFVDIPKDRIKPWGTAQAIYCAKDVIKEPFVVINADDFYGADAFKTAKDFIEKSKERCYATVGYEASKTITQNGAVKRGVLKFDENDNLISITESKVLLENDNIKCIPLNNSESFTIAKEDLVSMNMLIFDPSIFSFIEKEMSKFFMDNKNNLETCEFLIPDVLDKVKKEKYANVKVLHTSSNWYGVTYKEDADYVRKSLREVINNGKYPNNLWN